MPNQLAYFNMILAIFVLRLCDAFLMEENDRIKALDDLSNIKMRLTFSLKYSMDVQSKKYEAVARKFAKEKSNALWKMIAKRAEHLVIPESVKLNASEMPKYIDYKQLWQKPTILEIATLHESLEHHKNDDSLKEFKDAVNAKINFLESVRNEFPILYGDLEGKYIEHCVQLQKIRSVTCACLKEYGMFALHDHLNKVVEDVSRLLADLLSNMTNLNSDDFEERRWCIWALVEEVVKPLLKVKELSTNPLQSNIRRNAAEFLFVYEQLHNVSGIGMFDIGMKYNLDGRKRFATKWLEGTLDNVENLNFMPKGGKAVQPLPLHFGELIYNELAAQQESGKRN